MEQEASEELVGAECHCAVPRLPVAAVVLVAEGHAAFVERNEATVRDSDTVGVAGEIGEYRLRPGEGRLSVDEPVLPLEWCEIYVEGLAGDAGRRSRQRTRAGPLHGRRRAPSGTAAGTGEKAPAPAGESRACSAPSASRRAISCRPAQSYGRADGGSLSSPSCGAQRWRRCARRGAWGRRRS